MRCFQVKTPDGATLPALLAGSRTLVLQSPHNGIASVLDLLARGSDAPAWQRSALAAGALSGRASPASGPPCR